MQAKGLIYSLRFISNCYSESLTQDKLLLVLKKIALSESLLNRKLSVNRVKLSVYF